MDCPAGTVMSRLFRGRKILQGLLRDYAVEQGIIDSGALGGSRVPRGELGSVTDAPVDLAAYRRRRGQGEAG
jgi:RNA polymerase sigma-70 factor (ECF subfamily)